MALLEVNRLSDSVYTFDLEQAGRAGDALADTYRNAEPFPHIVIDDFMPVDVLRGVLEEWPDRDGKDFFDRDQERFKYQWQPHELKSARIVSLLAELNSEAMLRFIENMTGILNLVPDPYFWGGGLHETRPGGKLGIHADFNLHKGMNLLRRINLLIYLNEDWDKSFGGELELWDRKMSACRRRVEPVMARAVLFNTDLDSYHGHPEPLACPPERSRRSIALYYYTAVTEGLSKLPERTTVFRKRPGSEDAVDWRVKLQHFMKDWTPPAISRALSRGEG